MPPQPVYCSENNLFRVRAGYDDLKCPPFHSGHIQRKYYFIFAFGAACGVCRGKAPPSAHADRSPLKSPTGAFNATQTRAAPNAFSRITPLPENAFFLLHDSCKPTAGKIPLPVTSPSREKANQPDPQVWLICNTKNNYFLYLCSEQSGEHSKSSLPLQCAFTKSSGLTSPFWRSTFSSTCITPYSRWDGARNGTCVRSGSLPFAIKKPYFAVASISASL